MVVGGMYLFFQLLIKTQAFTTGRLAKFISGAKCTNKWATYFIKTATLVVMFFFQPALVSRTFRIFACVKLGAGESDWYLSEDLEVTCWQGILYNNF